MKVLLVEDDPLLAKSIADTLISEKYLVEKAANGEEALDKIFESFFDLMILDIMLPGIDGFTVLKTLRQNSQSLPVLILSAKNLVEDRVKGLDFGAEDYLTKPFAVSELLARIRALLRREFKVSQNTIKINNLEINTILKQVRRFLSR